LKSPSAYIIAPTQNEIITTEVEVFVSVTGGYDGAANLYLGEGKTPEDWILLYHADTFDPAEIFYLWNTEGLNGDYQLKLESAFGEYRVGVRIINDNKAEISSPIDSEIFKYLVPIAGNAYAMAYDSLTLAVSKDPNGEFYPFYSTTELVFDGLIYEWPVANMAANEYYIQLSVFGQIGVLSDTVRIFIESLMRDGFPIKLPNYAAFSPGTADIDGDGKKEIVIGTLEGLFAYNDDGTVLAGFPVLTDHDVRTLPAFDDIDGDGLMDIIILGRGILCCFNYLGESVSGWPREVSSALTFYTYPIPILTELYDQEDSVIMYLTPYGEVHAYRYNGQPYFYSLEGLFTALDPRLFDTSGFSGLAAPYLTANDLDDDGHNEVIGAYSTSWYRAGTFIWSGYNGLPAFGNITPLVKEAKLIFGGTMADIDNDGDLDLIVAGLDTNRVATLWVTEDGQQDLPGWPVQTDYVSEWIGMAPICVDIDNNGSKEVVIAFYGYEDGLDAGRIYVFNDDGTPYKDNFGQEPGLFTTTLTSLAHIIVADIDGNGMPNLLSRGGYIFPGTGYEQIYAWEPSGDLTTGFPIFTSTPKDKILSTPLTPIVDDLDGDGTVELIMCGDYGDIFVWNMDVPYDSDLAVWPRFRGDEKNSGINNRVYVPPTLVDTEASTLPLDLAIDDIYPNPFNPAATIRITLNRRTDIRLEVFNILGQNVKTLVTGEYEADNYEYVWDGSNDDGGRVASGIYFVRLIGGNKSYAKKMMLLR
jgi:hypothetical protein